MKTSRKVGLSIIVALAVLASLVVLLWRPSAPETVQVSDTSRGPSFEVLVEKPRIARPLFGILPTFVEEKLEEGGELRFDQTSPGAEIGTVGPDRFELRADGWDLSIATDGEGRVAPGTRLVYPIVLAERHLTLRCRPADGAAGYLRTAVRPGTDALDGSFLFECAICENVETGKVAQWPPAPLTIYGRFAGVPRSHQ